MLSPNTVLQKRYRIIRHLKQGGMGAVYEAINERVNSIVAIKETFAETEAKREAFEREAKLLANLDHEAFPKVMDHFFEGDGQYLVMELVRGTDLAELLALRETPFAPLKVLEWADQLLDALEEIHSYSPPIIHRDIKPANLKLTPKGKIKLLDFGIAKGAAGQMTTLQTDRSRGGYTPHYAPLEQILRADRLSFEALSIVNTEAVERIMQRTTDPRSDLYALGATLYHLMTDQIPSAAPTRAMSVWSGKPDRLQLAHELNPNVPPKVSNVLMQALALERGERPESAAVMRRMLRDAVNAPSHMPTTETSTEIEEQARLRREAEARRQAVEEEARKQAEAESLRLQKEAQRKEEEEQQRQEAERKLREEEAQRQRALEEAARLKAENEARQRAEEERRQQAEEQFRQRKEEVLRKWEAEQAARATAEAERRKREEEQERAADLARQKAEEQARKEAQEEEELRREEQARLMRETEEAERRRAGERDQQDNGMLTATNTIQSSPSNSPSDIPKAVLSPTQRTDEPASSSTPVITTLKVAPPEDFNTVEVWSGLSHIDPDKEALDKETPASKNRFIVLLIVGVSIALVVAFVAVGLMRLIPSSGNQNREAKAASVQPTATVQPADTNKSPTPPAEMAYVPGGTFTMGRDDGDNYERPAHQEKVKPFFIDLREVTKMEYAKSLKMTHRHAPSDWIDGVYAAGDQDKPVTGVNWYDADAYCKNAGKRLLTEEEWERAARGTDGRLYPWGNEWRQGYANANGAEKGMVDVGHYQGATHLGVVDMVGNAWEWTASTLKAYPGGKLPEMPSGDKMVIRGGNYKSTKNQATTTYRMGLLRINDPSGYKTTGLRCVKDVN
ncbi:MAG: bifunctional serine/threonine-protein kinase/formylglycine-generating enzyme family protein [Pyrinomonadaceae bacterium]